MKIKLMNLIHKRLYVSLTLSLSILLFSTTLFAGSVTLSWNPPTQNANGTQVTDLAGYKLYYDTTYGSYRNVKNAGKVTTYNLANLTEGKTYYFAVAAYDTSGNEGNRTSPVSITINYGSSVSTAPSTCELDSVFQETTLNNGMYYYTDRTYKLTSVPSKYIGLPVIKTPNDERNLKGSSGYMTFNLSEAATLYVAYDSRGSGNLPNWMSGFTGTGDTISTSLSTQPYLRIYRKNVSTECIDLGANKAAPASGIYSNYIVFYGDAGGQSSPTCELDSVFQETTLTNGMYYYTDRTYKLTSVPYEYIGMTVIKTPNNERNLTGSSGNMTFYLPQAARVYVAYDSRGSGNLPSWMSGFTSTGDIISTSLSTQPYLKIYSKIFWSPGCVTFGANKAAPASGSYSNYIVFY